MLGPQLTYVTTGLVYGLPREIIVDFPPPRSRAARGRLVTARDGICCGRKAAVDNPSRLRFGRVRREMLRPQTGEVNPAPTARDNP